MVCKAKTVNSRIPFQYTEWIPIDFQVGSAALSVLNLVKVYLVEVPPSKSETYLVNFSIKWTDGNFIEWNSRKWTQQAERNKFTTIDFTVYFEYDLW